MNNGDNRIPQLEDLQRADRRRTHNEELQQLTEAFAPDLSNSAHPLSNSCSTTSASDQALMVISPVLGDSGNTVLSLSMEYGMNNWNLQRPVVTQNQSPKTGDRSPSTLQVPSSSILGNDSATPFSSMPMNRSHSSRGRVPPGYSTQNLSSVREYTGWDDPGFGAGEFPSRSVDDAYILPSRQEIYDPQGSSALPSMYSGSSAIDVSSPMTRQNSSMDSGNDRGVDRTNGPWSESVPMASSTSATSLHTDFYMSQESQKTWPSDEVELGAAESGSEQAIRGCGSTFPSQDADSMALDSSLLSPHPTSTAMQRTGSTASTSTNRSTASTLERRQRLRQRSEQVIRNGMAEIRPKNHGERDENTKSYPNMKTKMPGSRAPKQRQQNPKIPCPHCELMFRGDHELKRHTDSKHSTKVTKFVCRNPVTVGIRTNITPKVPLEECKTCVREKEYGAYYNAAAHLRRGHFNPRDSPREGQRPRNERRGGSAGGRWPHMDELKLWYEERTVYVEDNSATINTTSLDGGDTDANDVPDANVGDSWPGSSVPHAVHDFRGTADARFPPVEVAHEAINHDGAAPNFQQPSEPSPMMTEAHEAYFFNNYSGPPEFDESTDAGDVTFAADGPSVWPSVSTSTSLTPLSDDFMNLNPYDDPFED